MEDVNYVCLTCTGSYHKEHHRCSDDCKPLSTGVRHTDMCPKCESLIFQNFEHQMMRKQIPARLRVEETDGA